MVDDAAQKQDFFEQLERNQKIVFKVVNTYCRTAADREDLAQDIVMQLWKAFPSWDRSRKFSTWMYRIALNVAISQLRKQKRELPVSVEVPVEELPVTHGASAQADRVQQLYHFIERLDPLNRALFLLVLEDHSHCEIADILGITKTNVATKINRLKTRCRNEITSSENM